MVGGLLGLLPHRQRGRVVDALAGLGINWLVGDGKGEVKTGTFARCTLDSDRAAVKLGDVLDDGEAKAGVPPISRERALSTR